MWMILHTWLDHLKERFANKKAQIKELIGQLIVRFFSLKIVTVIFVFFLRFEKKQFCPLVKTSCPHAENVNESQAANTMKHYVLDLIVNKQHAVTCEHTVI